MHTKDNWATTHTSEFPFVACQMEGVWVYVCYCIHKVFYEDLKKARTSSKRFLHCWQKKEEKDVSATNVKLCQCDKTPPFWVHMLEFFPLVSVNYVFHTNGNIRLWKEKIVYDKSACVIDSF